MKNGIIIAGFAGIGKSMLASKYENVIDLEIMDYKWNYQETIYEIEKRKGDYRKTRKEEWPHNYLIAIKNAIKKYDVVLISTDNEIINELIKNKIDFVLSFPDIECKEEYLQRYRERGNIEEFVKRADETFEELILNLKKMKYKKIVLTQEDTLEEKLKKIVILEDKNIDER